VACRNEKQHEQAARQKKHEGDLDDRLHDLQQEQIVQVRCLLILAARIVCPLSGIALMKSR
jgi:hypothetical protein